MAHNIILITWDEPSKAFEGFNKLKIHLSKILTKLPFSNVKKMEISKLRNN